MISIRRSKPTTSALCSTFSRSHSSDLTYLARS